MDYHSQTKKLIVTLGMSSTIVAKILNISISFYKQKRYKIKSSKFTERDYIAVKNFVIKAII